MLLTQYYNITHLICICNHSTHISVQFSRLPSPFSTDQFVPFVTYNKPMWAILRTLPSHSLSWFILQSDKLSFTSSMSHLFQLTPLTVVIILASVVLLQNGTSTYTSFSILDIQVHSHNSDARNALYILDYVTHICSPQLQFESKWPRTTPSSWRAQFMKIVMMMMLTTRNTQETEWC